MLKEREKQKVQAAEMRVLRKIAGVRRIDHVRNDDIRTQLRQEEIVEQACRKREFWKKQIEEQVGSITEGGQESYGAMLTDECQDACRHSSISNL